MKHQFSDRCFKLNGASLSVATEVYIPENGSTFGLACGQTPMPARSARHLH